MRRKLRREIREEGEGDSNDDDDAGPFSSTIVVRKAWVKNLNTHNQKFREALCLGKGYELVVPCVGQTILDAPEGCFKIYKDSLDMGVRFSLHSFIQNLLVKYNVGCLINSKLLAACPVICCYIYVKTFV